MFSRPFIENVFETSIHLTLNTSLRVVLNMFSTMIFKTIDKGLVRDIEKVNSDALKSALKQWSSRTCIRDAFEWSKALTLKISVRVLLNTFSTWVFKAVYNGSHQDVKSINTYGVIRSEPQATQGGGGGWVVLIMGAYVDFDSREVIRSMQKVKVRGPRSSSQRSKPNLNVSGL